MIYALYLFKFRITAKSIVQIICSYRHTQKPVHINLLLHRNLVSSNKQNNLWKANDLWLTTVSLEVPKMDQDLKTLSLLFISFLPIWPHSQALIVTSKVMKKTTTPQTKLYLQNSIVANSCTGGQVVGGCKELPTQVTPMKWPAIVKPLSF